MSFIFKYVSHITLTISLQLKNTSSITVPKLESFTQVVGSYNLNKTKNLVSFTINIYFTDYSLIIRLIIRMPYKMSHDCDILI